MTYVAPPWMRPWTYQAKKKTTFARKHEHVIPTKFRKHPLSGSVEKADNVFPYIYMH